MSIKGNAFTRGKHYYPAVLAMLFSIPWLIRDTICCDDDASGIDGRFVLIMLSFGIAALAAVIQMAIWTSSILQRRFVTTPSGGDHT
jgi:hypothetical protein